MARLAVDSNEKPPPGRARHYAGEFSEKKIYSRYAGPAGLPIASNSLFKLTYWNLHSEFSSDGWAPVRHGQPVQGAPKLVMAPAAHAMG
jgi:hypothetical protein